MNQKLENEDNHPPSGLISKIKKFFRNPFFIKTQSVSEVTDFLKDAVDLNIIDKEAESIAKGNKIRKYNGERNYGSKS